ncbi:MAG: polysaccharide deacetylase family protein [Clostridiaceae bacterium]|nr:polysaccharide deacetylase family protein [Clostridiaceae bacterium]
MRFFQIKRMLALLMTCAAAAAVFPATTFAARAERDLPIYCVGRDDNVVSLSFDAAWGNEDTQQLIDILAEHDIKATFFVVGEWVDKYPESVKALFDAGHEVMNHSNTHPHFTQLSPAQMAAEVKACADKIEAVTGVRPNLFRPPYGDYNDAVVSTMRQEGFYTIQWDVDSLDWKNPGSDAIVKRVLEKTKSGSIILFHNAAAQTPAALPAILDGLIARGFTFAPVSELIYKDGFYMDHTGMQVKE